MRIIRSHSCFRSVESRNSELTHVLVVSAEALPIGVVSTLDVVGCLAWGEA
jgi:hypothetical protein